MKIMDLICSTGTTGFYYDDQKAIKKGAKQDGFTYVGEPMTSQFKAIRIAGESISVMLILEDGQVAYGDCAAVQYSGAGGRDPLFLATEFLNLIQEHIAPVLIGREVETFKALAQEVDDMKIEGKALHTAIRYGVTQALLDAVSKVKKITMAEVIIDEYNTGVQVKRVPIFAQSGDERYSNVDKMIIKKIDVIPHALINHVETKLGMNGELLLDYVKWLKNRVITLRTDESYTPIFHIDVYGTIGLAFKNDLIQMADYLKTLSDAAAPFKLRIEGPSDMGEREQQMKLLKDLSALIDQQNIAVEIVADEWCNTLEDVKYFADHNAGHMLQVKTPDLGGINNIVEALLYCKNANVGAYSGGTCNETNRSAEITTNIAIACGAAQVLAKPGMGVDEGFMIVNNEMNRVIALASRRI